MFLCGVFFIPEVFGIRCTFQKFLVLTENLPFSLVFQKEIKNVEAFHVFLHQHGKELAGLSDLFFRPFCLHASPFMELALYQREVFFT